MFNSRDVVQAPKFPPATPEPLGFPRLRGSHRWRDRDSNPRRHDFQDRPAFRHKLRPPSEGCGSGARVEPRPVVRCHEMRPSATLLWWIGGGSAFCTRWRDQRHHPLRRLNVTLTDHLRIARKVGRHHPPSTDRATHPRLPGPCSRFCSERDWPPHERHSAPGEGRRYAGTGPSGLDRCADRELHASM